MAGEWTFGLLADLLGFGPKAEARRLQEERLSNWGAHMGLLAGQAGLTPELENMATQPYFAPSELTPRRIARTPQGVSMEALPPAGEFGAIEDILTNLTGAPPSAPSGYNAGIEFGPERLYLSPEQEREAIATGWQETRPAPLTPEQERVRARLQHADFLMRNYPEAGAESLISLLDPSQQRVRASNLAFQGARTADLLAGLSGEPAGREPTTLMQNVQYATSLPEGLERDLALANLQGSRPSARIQEDEYLRELEAYDAEHGTNRADDFRERRKRKPITVNTGGGGRGVVVFDPQTGEYVVDEVTEPSRVTALDAERAAAIERAETEAGAAFEAEWNWPGTKLNFEHTINTIDRALADPEALARASGLYGSVESLIPGTPGHDAFQLLETIKGQAFGQNVSNFPSLAPVSEKDRDAVINALVNLRNSQSVGQIIGSLQTARKLLRKMAIDAGTKAGASDAELSEFRDTPRSPGGAPIRYDYDGNRVN